LRKAGDYSYAIYLLHFFLINGVSAYVNDHIVPLTSIYVALPFAFLFFGYMTLLGWASHRLIEGHFMRFRRPYFVERLHPCSVQPQLGTMADNPVRT
jgi:peptidoglycan/LPS O-acetylase OafA/YrhL